MKRTLTLVAVIALALGGSLWGSSTPEGKGESLGVSSHATDGLVAGSGSRTASPSHRSDKVEAALDSWRGLYERRAKGAEEAEELIEARRAAQAKAVERLGRGGDAIVPGMLDAYSDAKRSREKLVLLMGLGANGSPAALAALSDKVATEDRFRLREEALRGVGRSPSMEAEEMLVDAMASADDERLQQIAAQSLYGRPGALEALTEAVLSLHLPMNVRLEAVHGIGGVGSDLALQTLWASLWTPASKPE